MSLYTSCGWVVKKSGLAYKQGNPCISYVPCTCRWCHTPFMGRRYSSTKAGDTKLQMFCNWSCRGSFIGNRDKAAGLIQHRIKPGTVPYNYKGRTTHVAGYVVVSGGGTRQLEHRAVVEETLGRKLLPTEVVHHINGDKTDNRPENLQVFRSQGEHLYHHLKRKYGG